MCVCVCVCVCVNPNLPIHPPPRPSMVCFPSVISLKFLQQSQDILGTHTLPAPEPSVFVPLQHQTWCLWELYDVQLVLFGVWRTEERGSDQQSWFHLEPHSWGMKGRKRDDELFAISWIHLSSLSSCPLPPLLTNIYSVLSVPRHIESDCHVPLRRVKSSGKQAASVVKHGRDLWDLRDGRLYQMGGLLGGGPLWAESKGINRINKRGWKIG